MAIRIYNTLSGKKENFETVKPGHVGIYLCGPTVYKPSHIGHAVGPIIFDSIKRYLVHRGFKVTFVVNITDVDDKLIEEAEAQNTTVPELADRVTKMYLDAMAELGVDSIDEMPKASEHIGDIVNTIQKLIDKDAAYVAGGGDTGDVYFDVSKDEDYGKLSNRKPEDQAGQRVIEGSDKRNPSDFALWKSAKPDEPAEVRYDSPWGSGRPGWHIECSAMSMRYLGETFDIHGGGMDLIFPHHENEVAQSETANGCTFATYWMHHGLTRFNTKKISKSDTSMQDALKKMTLSNLLSEYTGEQLRYFILSTHYRRPIEFSDGELEGKKKGLSAFHRTFERIERVCGKAVFVDYDGSVGVEWDASDKGDFGEFASDVDAHIKAFHDAMDEDFNTASGIASLFDLNNRINRFMEDCKLDTGAGTEAGTDTEAAGKDMAYASARVMTDLGRLLGLFQEAPKRAGSDGGDEIVDSLMDILIAARAEARNAKQFAIADMIRDRLTEAGVTLEDRADGTGWRR